MVGCLLVPSFPLACELAEHRRLVGAPAVVVGDDGVVEAASPAAEARGVHPGQAVREAIGRCPTLAVLESRPAHYLAVWEAIREAVEQTVFTVEPVGPGLVYVAMDELLVWHRSLDVAVQAVLGCAPTALGPRAGVAPTRFTSLLAARRAPAGGVGVVGEDGLAAFVGPEPVEALPVAPEMLRRLRLLGLRTMGDLGALPRSALAAQFGPDGILAWELARGRDRSPLRACRRPPRLTERLSLETPLASRPVLLAAWEQTLGRAARQPAFRGMAARQAGLLAATERGRQWSRTITFKEPLADPRRIWAALRPALEEAQFPGPLSELVVELRGLAPAVGQQLALPSARSALRGRLEEALRQLKARYGYCPVGRVVEVEPWSRVPERRLALIDFDP
ncbi:MAG TPA: DNA polymerase Y family protein [Candidatus Dormibacteraeota bacterium]|nr:DNA polymerase Y family protein [Candidatus Dormibacteraeota bacterium]